MPSRTVSPICVKKKIKRSLPPSFATSCRSFKPVFLSTSPSLSENQIRSLRQPSMNENEGNAVLTINKSLFKVRTSPLAKCCGEDFGGVGKIMAKL